MFSIPAAQVFFLGAILPVIAAAGACVNITAGFTEGAFRFVLFSGSECTHFDMIRQVPGQVESVSMIEGIPPGTSIDAAFVRPDIENEATFVSGQSAFIVDKTSNKVKATTSTDSLFQLEDGVKDVQAAFVWKGKTFVFSGCHLLVTDLQGHRKVKVKDLPSLGLPCEVDAALLSPSPHNDHVLVTKGAEAHGAFLHGAGNMRGYRMGCAADVLHGTAFKLCPCRQHL